MNNFVVKVGRRTMANRAAVFYRLSAQGRTVTVASQQARGTASSAKNATTAATATRLKDESQNQQQYQWWNGKAISALAATSACLLSGTAAAVLCDRTPETNEQEKLNKFVGEGNYEFIHEEHRKHNKKGVRDPMTSHMMYAMQKEHEKKAIHNHNENEQSQSKQNEGEALARKNVDHENGSTSEEQQQPVISKKSKKIRRSFVQENVATLQATSGSVDIRADSAMTPSERDLEEATRKAKQHSGGLKLFSGNGNMALALEIARHLGINLGKATVGRFADGEVNVVINENVRGKDVYVIQPTSPPVNDNIMELLLMVSTLRRASARRITVVIPYYGYARQDRKMQARVPISAADVARLMEAMGVDRVIAVDLHCGQIQGFFGPRVPVDNLDGGIVGLDYFGCKDLHNPVIVSPDAGGVYRAKKFKEGLQQKYDVQDLGLAMIVKQRARAGAVDQMDLVGDVKDCDCILVDDMIDTAGTLCKAAEVLIANGARRVFAFASHGLLSGPGNDRIANSKMEEVVILNTIPTSPQREANEKLTELSVAPLLAQAIFNIHAKKSISALFK